MREILFRGKSPITHEWVYGDLFQHGEQRFIMADGRNTEVAPKTVGEFTGLMDKNGVKIFEGDLIASDSDMEPLIVKIEDGIFMAERVDRKEWLFIYEVAMWRVVGNIYDNSELLGGDDHEAD